MYPEHIKTFSLDKGSTKKGQKLTIRKMNGLAYTAQWCMEYRNWIVKEGHTIQIRHFCLFVFMVLMQLRIWKYTAIPPKLYIAHLTWVLITRRGKCPDLEASHLHAFCHSFFSSAYSITLLNTTLLVSLCAIGIVTHRGGRRVGAILVCPTSRNAICQPGCVRDF